MYEHLCLSDHQWCEGDKIIVIIIIANHLVNQVLRGYFAADAMRERIVAGEGHLTAVVTVGGAFCHAGMSGTMGAEAAAAAARS
jgi:hypothetical protein